MAAHIDRLITSGTFSLDGGTWDVDNNVWIVGDDAEVFVIDPAHDPEAIMDAVGGRTVKAVLLTPADQMLWEDIYPGTTPDSPIAEGDTFTISGTELVAFHTPGHSPGSTCFYAEALGTVFTGDTLFNGGPGATGRSYSDFPTIVKSITERLLALPAETVVNTGHGDSTTIGAEAPGILTAGQ